MKHHEAQKGFTIIETLVAITILMIAIAGPLVVASKGLFSADLSKNQMTASYLAQESMEVIKNLRTVNIYQNLSWLSGMSSCTRTNPCDASALDTAGPYITTCSGGNPCPLYVGSNGYVHSSAGGARQSPFSRRFYIHDRTSIADCGSEGECGVTVEVYWLEGANQYSVIVTSEITSTPR